MYGSMKMSFTVKNFYTSKEWELLREQLLLDRLNEDGLLVCAYCGKPILKRYDAIAHHKIELTDENVNDYRISLNPDNVELIHFRCHNEIHGRFSGMHRAVYLVYGSPCSGKTTWVRNNAGLPDLIVDIDSLWEAMSVCDRYHKQGAIKQNVFRIYDDLLEQIKIRAGQWRDAYIIGGFPLRSDRDRMVQQLGCTPIFIDESKEVCLDRAKTDDWKAYIEEWFEDYVE